MSKYLVEATVTTIYLKTFEATSLHEALKSAEADLEEEADGEWERIERDVNVLAARPVKVAEVEENDETVGE